jgi:hypothetical protein
MNETVTKKTGELETSNEKEIFDAPVLDLSNLPTYTYPSVVNLPRPTNKFETEYHAFLKMLPQLLKTHQGKFVAIHEEKVVDEGEDELALVLRCSKNVGHIPIYVGLVTNQPIRYSRFGFIPNG